MNIFFAVICFLAAAILIVDAIVGWRLFRWAYGKLPRWLERTLEILTGVVFSIGGILLVTS